MGVEPVLGVIIGMTPVALSDKFETTTGSTQVCDAPVSINARAFIGGGIGPPAAANAALRAELTEIRTSIIGPCGPMIPFMLGKERSFSK